jgi:exonuclease VII small subunit
MRNHGASTARFSNSADSAWKIVDVILKQHETEVLLLQEEIVDLKRALNETQAGKTLYSDLQRLLAEQRDTVRSLAEQARGESNPQLARQLEAELKRIQKDFDKTFSEMKGLKISFGKRLLPFSKKPRGVRIILNFGIMFLSYSLICANRNPYVSEQFLVDRL